MGEEVEKNIALEWAEWIREQDDPKRAHGKPEALDDILVLDLSYAHMGGLFCSSILASFGAEVIRVEPPGGDLARRFTPFGIKHRDTGLGYLVEGRNKLHITLNLQLEEGQQVFGKLAQKADVVIETFKPGQMDAWGIGFRQLRERNPRLIYCALSTYGHFGPKAESHRNKPDYDVTDQALSGLVYLTGEPPDDRAPQPYQVPTKSGSWYGWYVGGAWAAFGILAALKHRAESGKGQMVDVSGAEGIMRFMEDMILWYQKAGKVRERVGLLDTSVFPYTFVRCKDGYAMIAGFSDVNFTALTNIMGRPELREDPRFKTFVDRLKPENKKALHPILEEWSKHLTSQEILEHVQEYMLNKRGPGVVATGRVNSPSDTLSEDHWWMRGIFQRVDDPEYGELLIQGEPWKATETPPRIKWACRSVGRDNRFIYLKYLGYGPSRLQELRAKGVI